MKSMRGFTLLELLIGMTLLGFMLALLFGGFRLAATSWDAVEARLEQTNDEQLARALVRRLLSQMRPMRWKKAVNQPIAFVGERNRLRAIAPLTGQTGAGGLRLIEFGSAAAASADGGGQSLVLRHAPLRYDADKFDDDLGNADSHPVLSGIETVEFSYFGPEKKGDPSRWQDSWVNPEQLPQLVRVHLGSRDAGWSDLIIAPMASATSCPWDPFLKRCRV